MAPRSQKSKKNTEAPFSVRVPDTLQVVSLIEKDNKRFPDTKGWAYAAFEYDPASDAFKPGATGVVNCGFACHSAVAAQGLHFHVVRQTMTGVGDEFLVLIAIRTALAALKTA